MPDVELAQRYLTLSEESRELVRRLLALQRDTQFLRQFLPAGEASAWKRRAGWVIDYLHGLDEQMTRHTALQGDLRDAEYGGWRQKAERLAAEWASFNSTGQQLLAVAASPADLPPSEDVRDEPGGREPH